MPYAKKARAQRSIESVNPVKRFALHDLSRSTSPTWILSVLILAAPLCVPAATLFWDGDGLNAVGGGAGTWDLTLARWSTVSNGSTYQAWSNAANDSAVFSGTGGTVTLGTALTVDTLTFTVTGYTLSGAAANTLTSSSGTLTIDAQTGTTIISAFYGATLGTIVKNGAGLLSSGTSQTAFAGKWVVNGGILSVAGDTRLGIVPVSTVPDQITLNGGFLRSSTASVTFDAKRGITLGASGGGFDSINTTLTWGGPITGSLGGPLTKQGSHNLVLTNNTNDYNGTTFVNAGRLTVPVANALGSTAAGTEIASGAGVIFDGVATNFTIGEPFKIAGVGVSTDGGVIVVQNAANVNFSGPVTLSANATVTVSGAATTSYTNANSFTSLADQSLTLAGGTISTGGGGLVSGIISLGSGGLTKSQGGRWTLGGANTYTGTTTVSAGTLNLANSLATQFSTVANAATVTFDESVASHDFTFGGLSGASGIALQDTAASPAAITLRVGNNNSTTSYTGVLSGPGRLVKVGTGTLTLGTANSYTGITTVSTGALAYGVSDAISTGGVTVSGATAVLDMGAAHSDSVGTVTLDGGGSILGTGGSALTTTGTFEMKNGVVTAILDGIDRLLNKTTSGTVVFSGNHTYTGATTLSGGVLQVGTLANGGLASGIGASTNGATKLLFDGGTLRYTGATTSTDRNFTITDGKIGTIDIPTAGTNLTISGGSAAGTGSLTKTGLGTLTLSGLNQHTGGTAISAGALAIGIDQALPVSAAPPAAQYGVALEGGTLLLGGNSLGTLSGGDAGTVTASVGTLTLTQTSTLSLTPLDPAQFVIFNGFAPITGQQLQVTGWTGTTLGGTITGGQILFRVAGWDSANLASIVFKDFEGADVGASAVNFAGDNNYYTIVPVPEPATWLGSLALLGLVVYRERRLLGSFKRSWRSS